eukprot:NODE_90_length_21577_cov_0.697691.p14 type:complete len:133 gc:universal NODE_90_length_21577_cov_0.697691:10550-10152(-)
MELLNLKKFGQNMTHRPYRQIEEFLTDAHQKSENSIELPAFEEQFDFAEPISSSVIDAFEIGTANLENKTALDNPLMTVPLTKENLNWCKGDSFFERTKNFSRFQAASAFVNLLSSNFDLHQEDNFGDIITA